MLTGAFYLSLGVAVLLVGTGILPVWIHDKIFELGQNNPSTMHLIQETGTLWVLVGILFIWFAGHYNVKFHWAVTFYLALDAGSTGSAPMANSRTNPGPSTMQSPSRCF